MTPISCTYGIHGTGPTDRVGETGTFTFSLNNSPRNSGGKQGYCTPGRANVRSGFELGINVRLVITYLGQKFYKFVGTLDEIDPLPGKYRNQITYCTAVDWMDEAAKYKLRGLSLQTSYRSDQIIDAVVSAMAKKPSASNLATAQMEYPFALDSAFDEETTAMTEILRAADSDLGYVFLRGDMNTGGVLTFHDRRTRMNPTYSTCSASFTLNETMIEMKAQRSRPLTYNRVRAMAHPRRAGTASDVLFISDFAGALSVPPSTAILIEGQYTDPNQRASRVGGASMITPVAGTDFDFGTSLCGPSDASSLSIAASYGANTFRYSASNGAAYTGTIWNVQARGTGLYDFNPIVISSSSVSSQNSYGDNPLALDMPYEPRTQTASAIADYTLSQLSSPNYQIESLMFNANLNDGMMQAALRGEPGDRGFVTETMTGISSGEFFINGVSLTIAAPNVINCEWVVVKRTDQTNYWQLDIDKLAETSADNTGVWSVLGL